jgi:hypothetical protein
MSCKKCGCDEVVGKIEFSDNYTTPLCDKCGKPFVYIGDVIGKREDYICSCHKDDLPTNWPVPIWKTTDYSSSFKESVEKYKMMKALEDLHTYFSDDDAEISENTLDLLEALFGKLEWRDKNEQ